MTRAEKIRLCYGILYQTYGPQVCFLHHLSPFQLLIATILSAQCTDRTVNLVTPELFRRWPGPTELADADEQELESVIHPCGFFHAKAKNIQGACRAIRDRFHGEVPGTMEELVSLPGVGRKTANVVLGDGFGVPGFPVDTHVIRLSNRIGLTRHTDPVKIESDLCRFAPPEQWAQYSHLLILHGRTCCKAGKTDCAHCVIRALCARKGVRS